MGFIETRGPKTSRRAILKGGLAISAGALTLGRCVAGEAAPPSGVRSDQQPSPEMTSIFGASGGVHSPRQRALLDFDWKFSLGNASDSALDFGFGRPRRERTFAKARFVAAVCESGFDNSSWRSLDLPHDWAVELPFISSKENSAEGWKPIGRDFPATSVGWYRRKFVVPTEVRGKRLSLEFDGIFRDAIVVLNNHYLGRNFSGYAPVSYDITDYVQFGETNTLVVRVDASLGEGWFYEGAGVYRHVWLSTTEPLHIPQWGTTVQSETAGETARVRVLTEVVNHGKQQHNCRVFVQLLDPFGNEVAAFRSAPQKLGSWGKATFESESSLRGAHLWSCEEPNLYTAVTILESGEGVSDRMETSFGIRSIHFDAERGFLLNDKPVKIKGTCNHQDHAGVGSAVPDRLQDERVSLLKAMGSNACRTAHNPVAPEFLDACDRAGMLVMSETRMMASTSEGFYQLERMIRRDRNHPSIVLWSLANEEPDQGSQVGANIVGSMKQLASQLDPTRPVTAAMNGAWGLGISNVIDVQGFNYGGRGGEGGPGTAEGIDLFHKNFPHQPTIGTETSSVTTTRVIYEDDPKRGYVNAYGLTFPGYTLPTNEWWSIYAERTFLSGAFAWTGFDYRGEPDPFHTVSISSQMGAMDTCGFPKDMYFYYKAWWSKEPVLHVFPHWNWAGREGQPIKVCCYSNLDAVELILNGKPLGLQAVRPNGYLQWQVPYESGVIEARGYRAGRVVQTERRDTTGAPAQLRLTPSRANLIADREDMTSVRVEVLDSAGRLVPVTANMVEFTLAGPGRIIGVGNGDPSCREGDKPETPLTGKRSVFGGLAMVYLQALDERGTLVLNATAVDLEPARLLVETHYGPRRLAVPAAPGSTHASP